MVEITNRKRTVEPANVLYQFTTDEVKAALMMYLSSIGHSTAGKVSVYINRHYDDYDRKNDLSGVLLSITEIL